MRRSLRLGHNHKLFKKNSEPECQCFIPHGRRIRIESQHHRNFIQQKNGFDYNMRLRVSNFEEVALVKKKE